MPGASFPYVKQEERMSFMNRQVLLATRPSGEPTPDNFRLVQAEAPRPGPGQMLLRTIYLSLDPYMRGRMNAGFSYANPMEGGPNGLARRVSTPGRLPSSRRWARERGARLPN
jgi:NADPH-dependent curcumin reductase CurA